jgi:dipeptidyl aminopeptidase/acylaminoacyl peptidase
MTSSPAYGNWQSPLQAAEIAAGAIALRELRSHGDTLYWLESRPAEHGRTTLMALRPGESPDELTPEPFNVRTRVHEYGGGAYLPCAEGVFFANWSDQRIYRIANGTITAVTHNDESLRFADFCWDDARKRLIAVTEQHQAEGEPVNRLQAVDPHKPGEIVTLHEGHDFYSSPAVSPNANRFAFICWDHPNMPWDGCQLVLSDLAPEGALADHVVIAGGARESVQQPEWLGPDELMFLSDRNGYWNLYRYDPSGLYCTLEDGAEYGVPQWMFGIRQFAAISDRHVVAARQGAETELVMIDTAGGFATPLTDAGGAASLGSVVKWKDSVCCLAEYPDRLAAIVRCPLDGSPPTPIHQAGTAPLGSELVSRAEPIEYLTRDGKNAHGYYYPPRNPEHPVTGAETERPPLLVMSHGGPTAAASSALNLRIQYYTTRGWAVVDVDYRGSSGYGRAYREALNGLWGVLDVNDCEDAVRHLVDQGLADPNRIAIRGGSAGGFTTLAALTRSGTSKAGASHYGIGDLHALARDTHKFESRYLHTLIGSEAALDDRSPIFHADAMSAPVIFFQGSDDRVVPPGQSREMADALHRRGIPVAYIEFAGEGHGFRRAENIARSLENEHLFFCRVFGLIGADDVKGLEIENL